MRLKIDVLVWRGQIPESRHRVQAVVADSGGRIHAATDQPDLVTTFRSAAKPFQVLPLVERGHADRWRVTDEELAVMTASHTGSRYHIELVRGLLARFGLTEQHLACGYHDPLDPDSVTYLREHPDAKSKIYNNCSGKHAGMLCLALSEGWSVRGYEEAQHPVQRTMKETVADLSGIAPDSLGVAIDGCSACVFGLPLRGMARAYANLATAKPTGSPREQALHRIRSAMSRYPVAVGGAGRFSTELMEETKGRLVAKGGAEGIECVGLPSRGVGVVLKCEDGQARGLAPAVIALLEQLDQLQPDELERLAPSRRPLIHNYAGTEVGALEATISIAAGLASEIRQ
jgi:L-asparaginase II